MGYYQTFIEKQERIKKEIEEAKKDEQRLKNRQNYQKYKNREYRIRNKEKSKKVALDWYYNNREYVLERQRIRKYQNSQYYREWYEKNKNELLARRNSFQPKLEKKIPIYNIYDNSKKTQDAANPFLVSF
jgi:hypothetical protein